MSNAHSTVTYVEPNMIHQDWQHKDDFERILRQEDYCIAMNIEVEISSRDSQGSIKDGNKDVIILQWNNNNKSHNSVSFMGGTKIGGYDINGLNRTPRLKDTKQNLTTYYADMYVGDLINYGTTEMIGIKSVDIEYAKSCVPIINIKFTDVRGLSLFQPTELSRDNSYNGIKGLNKDNVAQSFFQCFFKMPLPKFTIYIKGFYGNPVAYVCMCDKFESNFNSDTGDYDVNARFIGYSYSFMTDISIDALIAAPYSDFFGKQYWEDNKNNGRFFIYDKYKTHKMPIPTLFELRNNFKELIKSSNEEMENTTLTDEEKTHEEEIRQLKEIRGRYQAWYQKLYELLKIKYNKRYCFDFRDGKENDSDWYRILILTNSETEDVHDLREEYLQYSDDFKDENNNLYAAIENFNANGNSYKKLKNISKDFSEYVRVNLFNNCYVNKNTRKIEFGGFSKENRLNRVQVINRLFYNSTSNTEQTDASLYKDYTLSTIYNDGIDQYKDAFLIEVDYSDITRRINALTADANKSTDVKEREKRRKEHNRIMISKMNWYPSVENFTKIMMAHLETFMMMMYNVAESCNTRTPKDLGITIGKNGDACDVNDTSDTVPPFPRVIKNEIGEDGITKSVDTWVGYYENGKGFIEADMINGLFNAVDYLDKQIKEEKELEEAESNGETVKKIEPSIKRPLTSYDFFMTENPYGSDNDISNNPNAFAGKVAMRMFNILSINNFKKEYSNKFSNSNGDFLKKIGQIEAENFYDNVKITNNNMLGLLGAKADSGTIDPDAIINCVKNNKGIGDNNELPWIENKNDDALFDKNLWLSRYSTSYDQNEKTYIYPMQNMSFKNLDESLKIFNKGKNSIDRSNKNIIINRMDASANAEAILNSDNDSCFGSVFIVDDFKHVSNILDGANITADNVYKDVYDTIQPYSVFDAEKFSKTILQTGVFRPKLGVVTANDTCQYPLNKNSELQDSFKVWINTDSNKIINDKSKGEMKSYDFDVNALSTYASDVENGNITSWFFTECHGFSYLNLYSMSNTNSFVLQDKEEDKRELSIAKWGYGDADEKKMGFILVGLDAIDYNAVKTYLDSDATFTYVPKLAVLQIGAVLASMDNITDKISLESLSRKIPLPTSFGGLFKYLNRINYTTRLAYVKYFKDWTANNYSNIVSNFCNRKNLACLYRMADTNKQRGLFREDSDITSSVVNNLMSAVLIAKGNVNHFFGVTMNGLNVDETATRNYLDGFLGRLRELYGVSNPSESGGNAVKLVKDAAKTTEDMKKELYRYLKLVYDKWVPATDKKAWEFETFFPDLGGDDILKNNGSDGHLFHFIDSFYNKIGDKLLINPRLLVEKIDVALDASDINTMMLGFMADIYSQNKCMMMCLQNFLDFGKADGGMNTMFKPIPFNEMPTPHKHPDFVVVYPYEPSKYLNVDNGEFNNDSFMLNDEFETPLAVRSRDISDKTCYRIPAFGVSYGKQYQSYFKKVNVGMDSPIATQQSIMAKHAILRASQDTTTKTTVAQDMYDIYASQSYTCTVEMMGCAWIQPLMYFVLTNVPMFRGSYLIFKVNHSITPGNMITRFQGTRMANVSNKLVEDIFTDEEFDEGTQQYTVNDNRHEKADIDNDCPYKVFPLFEDTSNVEISGDAEKDGLSIMDGLIGLGYNEYAAAGVVGNMYKESYDYKGSGKRFKYDLVVKDSGTSGGLCMWRNGNLIDLVEKKTEGLGHNATVINYSEAVRNKYSEDLRKLGIDEQLKYLKRTMTQVSTKNKNYVPYSFEAFNNDSLASKSPTVAASNFQSKYERPKSLDNDRGKAAEKFYKLYKNKGTQTKKSQPDENINKDVYQALHNAVQKSIDSTSSPFKLVKMEKYGANVMMFKQADGKYDRLPLVFDILLNGYYEYIQKLWWVSPTEKDYLHNPLHIDVEVSQKVEPQNRKVYVMVTGQAAKVETIKFTNDSSNIHKSLLKSLYKKYRGLNNDIPQFTSADIFKNIDIKNCDTLMSNDSSNTKEPSEAVPNNANIKIDDFNVKAAVDHIINNALPQFGSGLCATYVENAIQAGGLPRMHCSENNAPDDHATNLRYYGILEKYKFVQIYTDTVNPGGNTSFNLQAGDVCIIGHKSHGKYHACMWTGNRWYSDHKQNNMISSKYPKSDAPYPYAIYRYHNKKGTPI